MLKKTLASVAVVTVIVVGVTSAGLADAASSNVPAAAHVHNGLGRWLAAHRRQIRTAVVTISSQAIGVSAQDLVTELRSGKSIADVAAEHGVSAQTVVTDLVNAADAKVAQAETENKLTSAQAAKIEAELPGYATTLVNHVFGQRTGRALRRVSVSSSLLR